MRTACLLAAAFALWLPISANAASPAATGVGNDPQSPAVEQIAVHCGPHAHYVPRHRNKAGHYVKGHCVRNHP